MKLELDSILWRRVVTAIIVRRSLGANCHHGDRRCPTELSNEEMGRGLIEEELATSTTRSKESSWYY